MHRVFHHFTMYGFIFCFIATVLGAIYLHILNIPAPYDFTQLPKIFGVIGGIALCIGVAGLFALFVMIPYSKFIHVFYRFIALVKYNMDEQEA